MYYVHLRDHRLRRFGWLRTQGLIRVDKPNMRGAVKEAVGNSELGMCLGICLSWPHLRCTRVNPHEHSRMTKGDATNIELVAVLLCSNAWRCQ